MARVPLDLLDHQVLERYFSERAAIRAKFEGFLKGADSWAALHLSDPADHRGSMSDRRTRRASTSRASTSENADALEEAKERAMEAKHRQQEATHAGQVEAAKMRGHKSEHFE